MITVPNLITLLRVFLVPAFIMASFYKEFKLALAIFVVAALSDALDGFLARRLGQVSQVGIIMDPLADKALIDSGFLFLSYHDGVIPPWLTVIVICRDLLILSGGWLLSAFGKLKKIKPSLLGKATAFSQFITILAVLLQLNFKLCGNICLEGLFFGTAALTVASAIEYAVRGIREIGSE